MEFIKSIVKNKKLIWQLGKNDFKNRFANTSLGSIWGFLQPFIFMLTYVIVFQYILKTGRTGNDPYVVWFLPAMSVWMGANEMILAASNSIRTYSYLVKKIVFPVDIIPIISIVASSFVSLFLILISIVVSFIYGYTVNIFMLLYILFCMYCFVTAFTRFTSAVVTVVPDFGQGLNIVMQLIFWFTPIIWNMNMLDARPKIQQLMQCNPFTYLVTGIRQAFIEGNIVIENHGIYTIVFWTITILLFLWGNYVFKKNKKDFADVL